MTETTPATKTGGSTAGTTTRPGTDAATGDTAATKLRTGPLDTEHGRTTISDNVVAKIAGIAAREIPGVHSMGKGVSRAISSLRNQVSSSQSTESAAQGVSVEVGQRQAAVDVDLVTEYGQSIVAVTEAVRDNVTRRVEGMTGLEVTEVNITVDDLYVPGDDSDQGQSEEPRVR